MHDPLAQIQRIVDSSPIVLFMKGTRRAPQCGFSAQVVQILDSLLGDYTTVNVLEDPALRDGIKEFSSWPTIPQLYIRGEFVGGCDIVRELHASGELEQKLGPEASVAEPSILLTERAAAAIRESFESEADALRLEIDGAYQHALSIGPKEAGDFELNVSGLKVVLDKASARRASGVSIDLVETPQGAAFRVENPNEPPKVRTISVHELKALLDSGEPFELFDVRTEDERQVASIQGARLLDEQTQDYIFGLKKDTPLYFHCHHGGRSQAAAEHFIGQGFLRVYNVAGGIDAWSQEIDPSVPRY